ncbi:MAG: aquaporin [Verrucomicrobiota bacterium]|jgi:aquaporin Z
MPSLSRRLLAEFLGTYAMIFAGTGAIVIDQVFGGTITHLGVALTWGLIVMVMIYTFGDLSGAHMNPAVSIGFHVAGRFPRRELLPYIGAQIAGAIFASLTLRLLIPGNPLLGATLPAGPALQSFLLEFLLTAILMLVIMNVSHGAKEKGITAGIAVGATIGLEALFAGPVCGASMNPARSLAPAIVSGHLEHLLIYLTAPVLGALAGVMLSSLLRGNASKE